MEEFHGMFQDLSVRMEVDEDSTAKLRKERDELLQKLGTFVWNPGPSFADGVGRALRWHSTTS